MMRGDYFKQACIVRSDFKDHDSIYVHVHHHFMCNGYHAYHQSRSEEKSTDEWLTDDPTS